MTIRNILVFYIIAAACSHPSFVERIEREAGFRLGDSVGSIPQGYTVTEKCSDERALSDCELVSQGGVRLTVLGERLEGIAVKGTVITPELLGGSGSTRVGAFEELATVLQREGFSCDSSSQSCIRMPPSGNGIEVRVEGNSPDAWVAVFRVPPPI